MYYFYDAKNKVHFKKENYICIGKQKGMLKEKKKHLFCTRNYIVVNYHSTLRFDDFETVTYMKHHCLNNF